MMRLLGGFGKQRIHFYCLKELQVNKEKGTEHYISAMRDQESHNSSAFNGDPFGRNYVEIVFEAFAAILIFVSSILTNSVVLYAIQTNSSLKTFTNKIIANLCLVDMAETLLIMPLWITSLIKGHWILAMSSATFQDFCFSLWPTQPSILCCSLRSADTSRSSNLSCITVFSSKIKTDQES
ncbi:hypothetical protein OS493_008636 [Desmophyllum pertusum]|uniref:G-protein coupled receptors family 1 profile domain-containing protein n=1 Tax=Desmophyllum pertusum TaxID=174260 RepID=A0A9X0D4S7_9CNID|nr:hypothetical protein OS493_008636 [Desmophyllum pertusum]